MKHYNARGNNLFLGLYTDLFIIGATRGANGASDFTDADNAQTFNLMTPADSDLVVAPGAVAYTKIAFAGDSVSDITIDVGDSTPELIVSRSGLHAKNAVGRPAGSGTVIEFDGTITLDATITKTGGTQLALLTAGEIWIYVTLLRVSDMLTVIDA